MNWKWNTNAYIYPGKRKLNFKFSHTYENTNITNKKRIKL